VRRACASYLVVKPRGIMVVPLEKSHMGRKKNRKCCSGYSRDSGADGPRLALWRIRTKRGVPAVRVGLSAVS
jgi:hypothetical protein